MAIPVRYDINAGEQLSSLLAQLNDKLTALSQLRATRKQMDLDCTPGAWQGDARTQFDNGYARQQSAFGSLADSALTIKGQVDQATQTAISARGRA
jgi:hypothetical protein